MDWFLGRTGLVIVEVTDLVISDDVVILVESLEILVKAFKSLYEEANPWNFVSLVKAKLQVSGGLQEETLQSAHS